MTADSIRHAVASGEYEKAAALFTDYARSLPIDADSLLELGELKEWVRLSILCARSHGQARIQTLRNELNVRAAYGC